MQNIITIKNLSKSYKVKNKLINVFEHLNLNIEKGKIVAIMGRSGSGKSTLLQILGLLDSPDNGRMEFDNKEINFQNASQIFNTRSQNMGFVFQSFYLMPELNVFENVELPLLISGVNLKTRTEKTNLILKKLNIFDKKTSMPNQISGGQIQRVAIARAMINQPKILFADEPTGNLDETTANDVMNLFKYIQNEFGTTVVIVTHSNDLASKCDLIINLEKIK